MYITYETTQWTDPKGFFKKIKEYRSPPMIVPRFLSKPTVMPCKLVRTFDMKVIYASEVNEGYCALSYSWNESGGYKIINKSSGKGERHDEGKHVIIGNNTTTYIKEPDSSAKKNVEGKAEPNIKHYVYFEHIIQQICYDFSIKYIWVDQLCIDQNNEQEKRDEIAKMHQIYSNAFCTVVLVPKFLFTPPINGETWHDAVVTAVSKIQYDCQWFKRLWTLEETIVSKNLLFVGQNIHAWLQDLRDYLPTYDLFNRPPQALNLRYVLFFSHIRTSTNGHDRVFALANVFPEFIKEIAIDYKQPLDKLMVQFYGYLAKKDLSILLFGKYDNEYKNMGKFDVLSNNDGSFDECNIPIQGFDLPSWTGVFGQHLKPDYKLTTCFQDYEIAERTMRVKCTGMTNHQRVDDSFLRIKFEDIPCRPNDTDNWFLAIDVKVPGQNESKCVGLNEPFSHQMRDIKWLIRLSKTLQMLANFMVVKKENLRWTIFPGADIRFNLTENIDNFDEHVILSGIPFNEKSTFGYPVKIYDDHYPVIARKHNEKFYKAIGACELVDDENYFSDGKLPKETYFIQ